MAIKFPLTRTDAPKAKPEDESKLGFGKKFSDHLFVMEYDAGEGWHDGRIVPYAPFPMDPACVVFHSFSRSARVSVSVIRSFQRNATAEAGSMVLISDVGSA